MSQTATRRRHSLTDATGVPTLPGAPDPVWFEIENGPGPTVLMVGGIHGDEHEAQVALRHLAETLDPAAVTGRLVIVPVLNYPAAQEGRRVSAADGQNMNRVFPGTPDGTPTERIADWLVRARFPEADLLIDVHAGGRDLRVVPMVFGFSAPGCAVPPEALARILRGWGYGIVQHMGCVPATVCHAALAVGLASVEVEGGGGCVSGEELAIMQAGLLNGLRACGVLTGPVPAFAGVELDAPEAGQVHAPQAGMLEHLVALGTRVEAGQEIARLHPLGGPEAAPVPVTAPLSGLLLRQSQSGWLPQGRQVGNIGVPR